MADADAGPGSPGGGAENLPVGEDVLATLAEVAETVVEALGFGVAVVHLVDEARAEVVIAAVAGPPAVRAALLHRREPLAVWDRVLAASRPLGRLRLLPADAELAPGDLAWVPEAPEPVAEDAWHPRAALFAPLFDADGTLLGLFTVDLPPGGRLPDAPARRAVEAFATTASLALAHARLAGRARRALGRLQALFDASPVPIGVLDRERRFLEVNDAYCRFLGRSRQELVGSDPVEQTHPDDRQASREAARAVRAQGQPTRLETRYVRPDGSVVHGRLHLAPLHEPEEPGVVVAVVEDVTERTRAQQRLVEQAHSDPLTGLPNRAVVLSRLQAALAADALAGALTAVFFCDLDRLKMVNDGYGHALGDAYLREVAGRVRSAVRDVDVVGRLGGDEFVVVCGGLATPAEAVGLAGRVIGRVREPLRIGDVHLAPSVSLGVAYAAPGTATAEQLLAQADAAMYVAKTAGRGSWHVYDPSSRNSAADQLQLRADLPRALERGELALHYQPVVALPEGRVVGHEALLRWLHPQRGLLLPDQFLDVVLGSEHESPVTDWALRTACRDAERLPGPPRVSVNVSSVQVARRSLPEVVARARHDAGLPRDALVLELTEDRLLSREDGARLLHDLRASGVRLALDDFGCGWAGLDYLQRLPSLDMVKLDRSFTERLGTSAMSEAIVRSVVTLTRDSGLDLVVEGAETPEQAARLTALGVPYAQGHLFGHPRPV